MGFEGGVRTKWVSTEERGPPDWGEGSGSQEVWCPPRQYETQRGQEGLARRGTEAPGWSVHPQAPLPHNVPIAQTRSPTSVAKKPLGLCLPKDARPPGPGLSLALMVC